MGRTILELAREACQRDNSAPAPDSLFSEEAPHVSRILVTAIADTMRDILRRTRWLGHSDLIGTWTFGTIPGRYVYPLPPDYLRIVPDTEHMNGQPMRYAGPATPQAYAAWIFGNKGAVSPMGWTIRNNALWLTPTPTRAELVTIDYISRFPVVSIVQPGDYDFRTQPPTPRAPLVPRDGHLSIPEGLDLVNEGPLAGKWDVAPPGWDVAVWAQELSEVLHRIDPTAYGYAVPQVRRPGFTTDLDEPAIGDDHVLSLGLTFRLRRALGLDYAEAAAEYEEELEARAANDAGGARGFRIGYDDSVADVIPLGAGRWMLS